eukprot:TRINITY_DN8723_c0_g1_i1.p1 TRINITY_DN8723_c0_g1~~TRINITY_DN8723_c0_g1_i1.p1  ORF type:complete len:750 (+),score=108.15 TRINITY_DN8723_c0_g1_i1:43-2292(+)
MDPPVIETEGLGTPSCSVWYARHGGYKEGLAVATEKVRGVVESLENMLIEVEGMLGSDEGEQELNGITSELREMSGEGLAEGLAEGKVADIREKLHKIRNNAKKCSNTSVVEIVTGRLQIYLGIYTRTLKLFFGTRHLSVASRPSRRLRTSNTWPKLLLERRPHMTISPTTSTASTSSPPHSPSPLPKSRLFRSSLPPPVETPCSPFHSVRDTPRRLVTSPRTPLSCISAHVISKLFKRRSIHWDTMEPCYVDPTPDVKILCRVCETPVTSERIEAHIEICAERMANLMALDHVIAQLKKAAGLLGEGKGKTLRAVADMCYSVSKGHNVAAILTEIRKKQAECEGEISDKKFQAMLAAAHDACDGVKRADEIAEDVMMPQEVVELDRLRRAAYVGIGDFTAKAVIARGAFGRVFLVEKRNTHDLYALKVMSTADVIDRHMTRKLLNERNIMAFTNSNLIVKLHYAFASTEHLFLAMDYHPGGDLFSLLERVEVFTEKQAAFYAAEIFLALEHLHKMSIVHRDVKPDNILLSNTGHIMLTDFGLSDVGAGFVVDSVISRADQAVHSTPKTPKQRTERGGTPDYVPPEIILGEPSDRSADFWSLGALLYEFLMGFPPFTAETPQDTFDRILRGIYQECECSDPPKDLISNLLQFEPSSRATNLRQHPFFNDIDWDTILTSAAPIVPDLSKDNFKERARLYNVSEADLDFLKEEISSGGDRSPSAVSSQSREQLVDEFLRRPQENVCFKGRG